MTTQEKVLDWLAGQDVGLSSKAMAFWLAFNKRVYDTWGIPHPEDPDDLDRCLRLLAFVPELRPLLPLMAELSPVWAALIERWDEIEQSHLSEVGLGWTKAQSAKKTYHLMRSIIDDARRTSRRATRR